MPNTIRLKTNKSFHGKLLADIHQELLDLGIPVVSVTSDGDIEVEEGTPIGLQNKAKDHVRVNVDPEQRLVARNAKRVEDKRFSAWKESKLRAEWEAAGKPDKYNAQGGA